MAFYKDNPDFELKLSHEAGGITYNIYVPANIATGYSTQRWVAAQEQQVYASAGANSEILQALAEAGIAACEDGTKGRVRTDNAALWNNVLYRLKYPVDMHCAIRMGAILSMMEYEEDGKVYSEPADEITGVWRGKKERLALQDEAMYTFFLSWGAANTLAYQQHLGILTDTEYFLKRDQALQAIMAGYSKAFPAK